MQQNNLLHNTMAASAVDGGDCRTLILNEKQSIVEICMDKRGSDGMFLFDSAEPGRDNQCNFLHPKHMKAGAENFLDSLFGHLIEGYGEDYCRVLFWGTGKVRREAQMTTSPKITEYLCNLQLSSTVTDMVQKREAGLLLPPRKKIRTGCLW